jgi:hypothetical protein
MKTFTGATVKAELQQILDDTTEWSDAEFIIAIQTALRWLFVRRPSSRYTSPVSYVDECSVMALDSSAIGIDIRWQSALTHYAAYQCFIKADRQTHNADMAKEQLRLAEEAL